MENPIKKCVLHSGQSDGTMVDLYPRTNLASVEDMTAFARTLNGAADAATARNTLEITTQAALINIIYPVGSVITLTNDTDPNELYQGTTWVKMDAGRVLVSAGTYTEGSDTYTYTLGDKGGEAKHQSTIEELASHTHAISISSQALSGNIYDGLSPENNTRNADGIVSVSKYGWGHVSGDGGKQGNGHTFIQASHSHTGSISSTGGNTPHENRSPYSVVQMWKRSA